MASGGNTESKDEGFEEFRKHKEFVFKIIYSQEFPSECEHLFNEIASKYWARMTEEERHPFNHEARLKREKVEHGGSNMAPLTPAPESSEWPEPAKPPVNPADDEW